MVKININIFILKRALKRKCNNAHYPDLYGHYREAAFTQTKHHWFWKTNTVFDGLEVTKYHTGRIFNRKKRIQHRIDLNKQSHLNNEVVSSVLPKFLLILIFFFYLNHNQFRFSSLSRGRPLRCRRLFMRTEFNAAKSTRIMSQMQHFIVGHILENIQLLHV